MVECNIERGWQKVVNAAFAPTAARRGGQVVASIFTPQGVVDAPTGAVTLAAGQTVSGLGLSSLAGARVIRLVGPNSQELGDALLDEDLRLGVAVRIALGAVDVVADKCLDNRPELEKMSS